MKFGHIIANVILYGLLLGALYSATMVKWDPWFAFVVLFVLALSIAISLIPGLHAAGVSPGKYPYND